MTSNGIDEKLRRIVRGQALTDIGDHRIGHVVAVSRRRMLVDTMDDGEMWLSSDVLFNVTASAVTLICERHRVKHYAVDPPRALAS